MGKSKKMTALVIMAVLLVGMATGFYIAKGSLSVASADDSHGNSGNKVDGETLEDLYQAAFGRSVDSDGYKFFVGKDLKQVLQDINNSDERRYYSALFKAVKAYEDAIRAPGDLSASDKQSYLNIIDSALSNLIAWVQTLPDQPICNGTVGPEHAREMIERNFERLNPTARAAAKHGLFNALSKIAHPQDLELPHIRCLKPSPTPTPSSTPTPTPSVTLTPTPTPSVTTTPTPTSTPTPTPTPTPAP